jgi:hypothetical protein
VNRTCAKAARSIYRNETVQKRCCLRLPKYILQPILPRRQLSNPSLLSHEPQSNRHQPPLTHPTPSASHPLASPLTHPQLYKPPPPPHFYTLSPQLPLPTWLRSSVVSVLTSLTAECLAYELGKPSGFSLFDSLLGDSITLACERIRGCVIDAALLSVDANILSLTPSACRGVEEGIDGYKALKLRYWPGCDTSKRLRHA